MLSTTGRSVRLVIAVAVLALTVAGTIWGQDGDFPFGPFRMYSTRDNPNAPTITTEIEGITPAGKRIVITGTETGLRRAEVEGQLSRFTHHPKLLATIAQAYQNRHDGRQLTAVEIVRHDYGLSHGKTDGHNTRTILAHWTRPS